MQQKSVVLGGQSYNYSLRRSKRARHLLLHVGDDGTIEVVVPWRVSYRAGEAFLREQSKWLESTVRKKREAVASLPSRRIESGALLPVFGDVRRLLIEIDGERSRTRFVEQGDEIQALVSSSSQVRSVLVRWYKQRAREYFERQVRVYAEQLGVLVRSVVVSNANSQWGSCIAESGRISLAWRLALGPLVVADYVIGHEVAHMLERGHTKQFWRVVERLDGDYGEHRAWLRRHGRELVL